jgi:hypothetical protein
MERIGKIFIWYISIVFFSQHSDRSINKKDKEEDEHPFRHTLIAEPIRASSVDYEAQTLNVVSIWIISLIVLGNKKCFRI